jgi:O-antigen/teichoic acid export membrane protein
MWYGLSSIAARFINYLLTPYLTFKFSESQYGEMSVVYAFIPFMNIVFTYGMETAYFRFVNKLDATKVYNTINISIVISSIIFSLFLLLIHQPLATILTIENQTSYLFLAIVIIVLDALTTIPFAKLRQDNKPKKFAFIRIVGILINILCIYFFLSLCPSWIEENKNHWCSKFFNPNFAVGYVLVANIIQSGLTLILLYKEFFSFRWKFDYIIWKKLMLYSLPLLVAGFGGMINETFDRIMLSWWAPVQNEMAAKAEVGIYAACYKLAILISLSVQAFRMGAEPFFFKKSSQNDAQHTYARIMKFFVISVCFMFLIVVLYLDIWKEFIRNPKMWVGLKAVPILLLANIFLGIYYNLSIWYKLVNKTMAGAYITLIGAIITIAINYIFIPYYSYMACAWATLACYGSMMIISYLWGQKEYPIPYDLRKILFYLVLIIITYFLYYITSGSINHQWLNLTIATLYLIGFIVVVIFLEKNELRKIIRLK